MGKFFAVYYNEMIKTLHKKSVWILSIIMLSVILLVSGVVLLSMSLLNAKPDYDSEIEWANNRIEMYEQELNGKTGADITDSEEGNSIFKCLCLIERTKADIKCYEALNENEIYNNYDYRAELLEQINYNDYNIFIYNNVIKKYGLEDYLENGKLENYYSDTLTDEELNKLQAQNEKFSKIVTENDFKAYIDMKNEEILANESLSEIEKRIAVENNNLRLDGNITGEYPIHTEVIENLKSLTNYKISVETGIDYVSTASILDVENEVLTPSTLEKYKNQIAIIEYKFESGYYNINEDTNRQSYFNSTTFSQLALSVGMTFILILIIILAGSSVSKEMSDGSVKALLVAPVKRWKIFTAKALSLLTVGFSVCLLLVVAVVLLTGVLFGFDAFLPYVYYASGTVVSMNFVIYTVLYALALFVQVLFYGAFAMMLSAVTRNTAVSVGVSIGVHYFMSSIVSPFMKFVDARWAKYIPTEALSSLPSLIFPNTAMNEITSIITGILNDSSQMSAWFAVIYIAAIVFAMIFTARDSFCRRDIK